MASSQIKVAGPPRKADQARVGFPWILPLTSPPSALWATRFAEIDWPSLAPQLRPPYHPRLDGDRIWLPGFEVEVLRPILDIVADRVDLVSREVVEEEQAAVSRDAQAAEARRQQEAAASDAFDEWWRRRDAG